METSCGVLFVKNGHILLGHTTGQKHWDIPKGKMEDGEGFMDAAIRETQEEIGFTVDPNNLKFIGEVPYKRSKRLALFLYVANDVPKASDCYCESTYINKYGAERPELDYFKYVPYHDLSKYITPRLFTALLTAIETFNETK